jgi:hypothetical protein
MAYHDAEAPIEHLRNAVQLAQLLELELREPCTPAQRTEARLTLQAIETRLAAAIAKLEPQPTGRQV